MKKINEGALKRLMEDREDAEAIGTAAAVIEDVKKNGDKALRKYSERFDGVSQKDIKVPTVLLRAAEKGLEKDLLDAVAQAAGRIEKYHAEQMPCRNALKEKGILTEFVFSPVQSAGIYIPSAQAPLLSTILMTVIPARVAGVPNLYVASPPSFDGGIHPVILGVLSMFGITNVFAVGGAQALAAFAYGTETVPAVDVIAGPGNRYVNAAKRLLYGQTGIDLPAGPSELVIFADDSADEDFIEADMNGQIEHEGGLGILITTSKGIGKKLEGKIKGGYWLEAETRKEAVNLINLIAPEHLQLMCADPRVIAADSVAGAVFIGNYSPAALGDYYAGPSHVLPTGKSARFASGLSVYTFLRSCAVIEADAGFYKEHGRLIEFLAQAEGLLLHRDSIERRRKKQAGGSGG